MAVDEKFQAVITVDDRTSVPIRRIQQNLARIGDAPGLRRFGQISGRLSASFGGLVRATASMSAPLAAVGAVGAGAGLLHLARSASDSVGELDRFTTSTGLTIAELQELGAVARSTGGVELDNFVDSMQELQNAMREAAQGDSEEVAKLFKKLRIPITEMRNGRREVRSLASVLPDLAEAFRRNEDPAARIVMASRLMTDEGRKLIPMLVGGARGLAAARAEARQYAATLDNRTLDSVRRSRQGMINFSAAMEGVRLTIGARLAPILGDLGQHFADLIKQNREAVSERLGGWASEISTSLKGIDWREVADGMESIGRAMRSVNETVTNTTGWKNAFIGIGALLAAPFAAGALSAVVSLGKIVAFLGGPVTLAIAGIGTAIVTAWKYWDEITGFINKTNAAMKRLQDSAIASVLAGFREILGVVERIMDAWDRGQGFQSPAAPASGQGQRRMGGRAGNLYDAPALDPDTGHPLFRRQSLEMDPDAGRSVLRPASYGRDADAEDRPFLDRQAARSPWAGMADRQAERRTSLWERPSEMQRGEVEVSVRFENAPPGTRVDAETRGRVARSPTLDVGYARLGVA
ncbi:hypothetical protein [Roseomonas xinghualingensis]|uniref:hypothetical protein n=1 Tax=Roseomonas xinghualingensis TaxID=2986475 RepID=UPI0021F0BDF3|nr:hypothetical protein [Roseomonas sp. SXEYE001]MCV4209380.1 hypothetical protein [Roseomonas sp. SXEYE001]